MIHATLFLTFVSSRFIAIFTYFGVFMHDCLSCFHVFRVPDSDLHFENFRLCVLWFPKKLPQKLKLGLKPGQHHKTGVFGKMH